MSEPKPEKIRTNINIVDGLLAFAAGVFAGYAYGPAFGFLTFILIMLVMGVWRMVRFLGYLLVVVQVMATAEIGETGQEVDVR